MRRLLLAGNWKMHLLARDAERFAEVLPAACDAHPEVDVALLPAATVLPRLKDALAGTRVLLGGQDCHHERQGAFTGEISAEQLADAGATLVLVGHSERRTLFGETDELVARKLRAALRAGLRPMLCVGETEDERDGGRTEAVLARQAGAALRDLRDVEVDRVMLAYEPTWAIGTGRTATAAQAQEAHAFLRAELRALHGEAVARDLRILYGGSVKPDNVAELVAQQDVDGGLVGGASLDPAGFVTLIQAAARAR